MKKKGIMISIIALLALLALLTVIITTIVINKNHQKYIMQDGMMIAMTLTDENGNVRNITSFPTGENYHVDIECDGGNGKYQPVGSKTGTYEMKFTVEDISSTSVKCNVHFITITDRNKPNYLLTTEITNKNTLNTTQGGICSNEAYTTQSSCLSVRGHWYHVVSTTGSKNEYAGIRYTEKLPNNWVWFNDEKWRIIGSIPTCTSSGCTTKENLVKIIRSDALGSYAYDADITAVPGVCCPTNYTGVWGENSLYRLLNTYYYAENAASMNGQNDDGCYGEYDGTHKVRPDCDFTERGILSSSYYGKMVRNVFWNTGGSTSNVTAATAYTDEIKIQTVQGHVGLVNASDWRYAEHYISNSGDTTNNNWLFNNYEEWTSTPHSGTSSAALRGGFSNGILSAVGAKASYVIRPVVYLDSSVYIISGDGSEGNPYQIGM